MDLTEFKDILPTIFSLLDLSDVFSCHLVCKKWYIVFRNQFVWKKLLFRNFGYLDKNRYVEPKSIEDEQKFLLQYESESWKEAVFTFCLLFRLSSRKFLLPFQTVRRLTTEIQQNYKTDLNIEAEAVAILQERTELHLEQFLRSEFSDSKSIDLEMEESPESDDGEDWLNGSQIYDKFNF